MIKVTIEYNESDTEFLKSWIDDVGMLVDVVIEAMEENPSYLLSPVMRRIMAQHAHKLKRVHSTVTPALCLDNPANPMKDRTK